MNLIKLSMKIIEENKGWYKIAITRDKDYCQVWFSPVEKKFSFPEATAFCRFLEEHTYQLGKILRNKRLDTFYIGFELNFILWEGKDVAAFNDRSNIVVVDRRFNKFQCYVQGNTQGGAIDELYIDGSFMEMSGSGGYVILHKDIAGDYHLYPRPTEATGSNQVELLAALSGLRQFRNKEKIRIITDSQYVRKGLSEWMIYWQLNDFTTANGEKAKNIDLWKEAEQLTRNRYIELEWVKAHADHFENTICDLYAKDAAHFMGKSLQ